MAKEKIQELQAELAKFLIDNGLNIDVHFYRKDEWAARKETVGNNSELTMTFEGAFYTVYNYSTNTDNAKLMWDFLQIVKKHGYYAEQGYAWSLHFYPQEVMAVRTDGPADHIELNLVVGEAHEQAKSEFDLWGEDPEYPRKDWKHEVADDNTSLGYWDWVLHSKERDNDANVSS